MTNGFETLGSVPELTLEPFKEQPEQAAEEPKREPELKEEVLTEEEREMVESFAKQIDLTNSAMVLQYGAGTQKKMADFSESAVWRM